MDHSLRSESRLDMSVQVKRAATGKVESIVPECDLERYGFGLDPEGAVERYRQHMESERVQAGDSTPSWTETEITVCADEEFGYPLNSYHLKLDGVLLSTRKEAALRLAGQYLIDLANGLEPGPVFIGGQGLELSKEG